MNPSDTETGGEPGPDPCLGEWLRSLPTPGTPPALESRVRTRIRRRRIARAGVAAGSALALVAVLAWQVWLRPGEAPGPVVVQHAPPSVTRPPAREIPADELDVLFAPPPVDPLAIVGVRNEGWVAALNRLEDVK